MAHQQIRFTVILKILSGLAVLSLLSACATVGAAPVFVVSQQPLVEETPTIVLPTPMPTRPPYVPGTLVDYTAQTGDTLPALASHFNTTESEIRAANPIIPEQVTTLPAGLPMKIPIYYQLFWGSPYHILPDSQFANGPAAIGFDVIEYVEASSGWFKNHTDYLGGRNRRGGEIIEYVSTLYSVNPRLLLAILEYQTGAVSEEEPRVDISRYPLGHEDMYHLGVGRQLYFAANLLNNGFYGWRTGELKEFDHLDGRLERPDPWQNAATVAIQSYFSKILDGDQYALAISSEGLEKTYHSLFGSDYVNDSDPIPGSLQQPELRLPFLPGKVWAYTGGPHTAWGEGFPLAAIDFAPPMVIGGCAPTEEVTTAVADGVVVRANSAIVTLDLDGDGDERTGWVIFYLHVDDILVNPGSVLKAGDPIGKPSCEGGSATGTHVHLARKYNGEWVPASGPLAFNLEGWIAQQGSEPYQGTLTRFGQTIRASVSSDQSTRIQSDAR